ncbi:MAG: hypothetical protein WD673_06715 [Alphaproteobacteria bacterium]
MASGVIGQLPLGVRPGTAEAREAGLSFSAGPARAQPAGESFGFDDLLDIINPLQHLPIIGTLYREWTGDTIDGTPRILGSALFGGPIGLFLGIVNAIFEDVAGEDIGGTIYAGLFGGAKEADEPVVVAAAAAEAPPGEPVDGLPWIVRRDIPAAAPVWHSTPAAPTIQTESITPAAHAVTSYQDALEAMASALDRYQAHKPLGGAVDQSY